MRKRKGLVSLVAAAALVLGPTAVGAGATPRTQHRTTATSEPVAAAAPSVARRLITLVTGDRVVLTSEPGGRTEDTFLPAAGHSSQFLALRLRGDSYLVPRDALAGMGRDWVLDDFDLTQLAAGRAVPARPTRPGRGAYRDVLSSSVGSQSAAASGGYHLKVLTLDGINDAGKADDSDSVILINLENTELYTAFLFFDGKPIKLQVPVGHYAAIGTFFGTGGSVETVVVPQVAVANDTTVVVDARTATESVRLSLPVPTTIVDDDFTVVRTALKGSFGDTLISSGDEPILINPVAKPTIGSLQWMPQWHDDARTGDATYDVAFTRDSIPSQETFTAGPDDLAAVHTTYASDGPTRHSYEATFAVTPDDPFSFAEDLPITRPLTRTEYYSTGTAVAWSHLVDTTDPFSRTDVEFSDSVQSFRPGSSSDAWLSPPLGPALPVPGRGLVPALSTFYCAACRSPHLLDLDIAPWGDGTPGHVGFAAGLDKMAFTLYRGAAKVASGEVPEGSFPVPAAPADYRLTFSDQRTTPLWDTSTDTSTAWTFASAEESPDLPAHWLCPDGTRRCATLPLLFPRYTLPTDLQSQERSGSTGFVLGFDHDDATATVPVGDVRVSISYDGGHTWTAATVRNLTGDNALISYTNPATAGHAVDASLRVSAVDGAGATVTQTVIDAYAVTGA